MNKKKSKLKLKESFASSFHEQFAVNQNTQFTLLITISVSLATVLAGLGYVIGTYCVDDRLIFGNNSLIYAAATTATALYGYGVILLVSAMSFSFRRDQLILNSLRKELDMFAKPEPNKQYLAFFPQQYTGERAFEEFQSYHLNWMPNHYAVITRIILLMLLIVNVQFIVFLKDAQLIQSKYDIGWKLLTLGSFTPFFLILSIFTPIYYRLRFNLYHREIKTESCLGRMILWLGTKFP
ncbi:hypothetical protein [Leptospira vanthielii]|uniref:Uncharacterized protein n=1 Tax=Leptospira vanthielii serovar Holland str. Waz Holland = ATCC 700522 TaxID=1218591 RepID=N1W2M2_9LEPT|nr:hypothetical protein [Leptospira vanthielii]EMY70479.1 hypothetical protein LEP1GSC199_1579 [Leptospira vanthielii serovar Holland str. Waz Holland = ATCC 700522]